MEYARRASLPGCFGQPKNPYSLVDARGCVRLLHTASGTQGSPFSVDVVLVDFLIIRGPSQLI